MMVTTFHGTSMAMTLLLVLQHKQEHFLMIFYFGWAFTIVLTTVMIIFSVIQGATLQKIMEAAG